jgi:predicted transcriptional regulator of viral defense system
LNALEFLARLKDLKVPFVQTKEIAAVLGISVGSAGKYLHLLQEQKFVEKVTQGKWVIKDSNFDPLQVAEFITAPKESYISLHTALFYHDMIDQIPSQTYIVTVDRSRRVSTPVGIYSFHHCNPEFFIGYKYLKPFLKIATPEKALVDYFYFLPTKTRLFTRLPELEIPKKFSWKKVLSYCDKVPSMRTRTVVLTKIKEIMGGLA